MKHAIRLLAVATALTLGAAGAQAALSTYTSLATFTAATTAPGTDAFTGLSTVTTTASPLSRVAGSYSYTATASTSSFFAANVAGNTALSTNLATDSITFSNFSSGVTAIGGNFFGSDINGNYLSGNVSVTATDAAGASFTQLLTGATTSTFLGFSSTAAITSLVVSSVYTTTTLWPTVDNLVLAKTTSAVPEPANVALLVAGLALVGTAARRRRAPNAS